MKVKILAFGKISEIINNGNLIIESENSDDLKEILHEKFPQLKTMQFRIAIDKKTVSENINFQNDVEAALLPPFSGG